MSLYIKQYLRPLDPEKLHRICERNIIVLLFSYINEVICQDIYRVMRNALSYFVCLKDLSLKAIEVNFAFHSLEGHNLSIICILRLI